jgi:hypothetical protein
MVPHALRLQRHGVAHCKRPCGAFESALTSFDPPPFAPSCGD